MQITRIDNTSTQIKLLISASADELAPIKEQTVKRLGKDVKLPGFRSGKAPQALIEKNLDQNMLQNDFLDEAMTQLYAKATLQENIRPVTRPEVAIKKFVPYSMLEYEVTTEIVGNIKLPNYRNISVTQEKPVITTKDVTGVIDSLKLRMAEKKEVTRAAKSGDEAIIDFKGTNAKKEPIEGAEGSDYPLQLGSAAFIPGFEDNVIGLKPGAEKTFVLTFPKDYGAKDLAGKKVTFTVTLKKVNELVEPKADDAFAAKVGPFKSLEELKTDIKKQLTAEREREAEENYQDAVLRKLSEKTTMDIPDSLIKQQVIYNLDEIRRNLVQAGKTYEEYLKAEKKTEEAHKKELEQPAHEQLKASLILSEIAEVENITLEPEELNIRVQMLKGQYKDPAMQAELDIPENRRSIASRMLSEKVINFVISTHG
ncbi:MAG: trigger factor [Candidatus Saccharimonadales bacterium]